MGGQQSGQSQASAIGSPYSLKGDGAWSSSVPIRADKVLPYIYIGNYSSACSQEFLQENGIVCIVNVTQEPHDEPFPNVKYLHLAAHDVSTNDLSVHFDAAHRFLTKARLAGEVALVHCHAGVSRSVSVVMAHLLLAGRIYDDDVAATTASASGGIVNGPKDNSSGPSSSNLALAPPEAASTPSYKMGTSPEAAITQSESAATPSGAAVWPVATSNSCAGTRVSLEDVWKFVKSRRNCAHPNPGFFASLQELEMRITGASSPSLSRADMCSAVYGNSKLARLLGS